MADRSVRMYNPTHRMDTSAAARPPTDPAVRWEYQFQEDICEVAVWDETVYMATGQSLVAIGADGASQWSFETDGGVESSPAVVDGTVYVGSNDHRVYALDAASGIEQWSFETDGQVFSSPAVVDGTVYVGSFDGSVYALGGNTEVYEPSEDVGEDPEQSEPDTVVYLRCSSCGADLSGIPEDVTLNFCPECGAKR